MFHLLQMTQLKATVDSNSKEVCVCVCVCASARAEVVGSKGGESQSEETESIDLRG